MPFTDIPILLINAALLAIIALPFVLAVAIAHAAHKIVRPLWAIYQHEYGNARVKLAEPVEHHAPVDAKATHRSRVHLSAFGR